MPETRYLLALRQHVVDDLRRMIGVTRFEQQLDYVLVRAAMQRPLKRPDSRSNRRINIGQSSRRDSRRKSGGVKLMIGMQSQRHVEGMLHHLVGPGAGESIKEVGRQAEAGIAGNDGPAVSQAIE